MLKLIISEFFSSLRVILKKMHCCHIKIRFMRILRPRFAPKFKKLYGLKKYPHARQNFTPIQYKKSVVQNLCLVKELVKTTLKFRVCLTRITAKGIKLVHHRAQIYFEIKFCHVLSILGIDCFVAQTKLQEH